MAESSLDDFFAKKDKSKKKTKSKFTPSDLAPTDATEKPKKTIKKKKAKEKQSEKDSDTTGGSGPQNQVQEDAEWVDFEQETEKDYSGLRIQNLQISAKEDDDEKEDTEQNSEDEEGEGGERRDTSSGPWNKMQSQQTAKETEAPPQPPKPKEEVAAAPSPAPKSGKYIPPGMRRAMESGGSTTGPAPSGPRKKKVAPNLKSVEDFPTLGGPPGGDEAPEDSERVFERVKAGGRSEENPGGRAPKLELGNKYDALSNTTN